MTTQKGIFPFALSDFRAGSQLRWRAVQFLFMLSILLGVFSTANAQTPPQQYVYGSQQLTSASSVLSGFSKASQTGALSLVPGSPFNERLEGGLVAIDGQGKFLFVLNPTSNDISMFQIDQTSGALTEVPASPFQVPPTVNSNQAPSFALSIGTEKSGKFVFVGYAFGDFQGQSAVVSLSIDTSNPNNPVLVTQQSTDFSIGEPLQLLTDPKGLHLYVGLKQGQNGQMVGGADVYSIDSSTGRLSYMGIADISAGYGRSTAIDPVGRFFFAGWGWGWGFIDTCMISPVDGTATGPSSTVSIGPVDYPNAMVVDNSGGFLYVAESNGAVGYSIDQVTGALTQVQGPFTNISFSLGTAVADPEGPYLYSLDGLGIHVYQIGQQTGNLTEIPGSPFNDGVNGSAAGIAILRSPGQAITGPVATFFPTKANFGSITVGTSSATQVFSIVNIGGQNLTINSISITGTNASSFSQSKTCTPTLAPNANCSVSITFTPASEGALSASLQVADNAPGSPQTLALNGTGVAPVPPTTAVTLSPAAFSFPTITQGSTSAPQTLTVTSSGSAPLHISSVALGGPNPSDFSFTNNCTAVVAPGSSCTISLVFNPIGPGIRTATLEITDDAPSSPQSASLSAIANPAFFAGAAPNGSTTATVSAGQSAQYLLQLTPGPGYSGSVSLTCGGAPLGATCQVPASVSLSNGAVAPFTATVRTSGAAMLPPSAPVRFTPIPGLRVLPLLAFALVLLMAHKNLRMLENAAGRRRLTLSGALAAAVFCVLLGVAGCGGGSTTIAPPPVITPSGTSTITVTPSAMSSSGKPLQLQPIQLTLTVK